MNCPGCDESLRRAVYRDDGGLKSCPRCSTRLGRHVFRPLDDFGERRPHGGEPIMQSWCRDCRGDRPARPAAAYCSAPAELHSRTPAEGEAGQRAG
jgi:hypothetical protein